MFEFRALMAWHVAFVPCFLIRKFQARPHSFFSILQLLIVELLPIIEDHTGMPSFLFIVLIILITHTCTQAKDGEEGGDRHLRTT